MTLATESLTDEAGRLASLNSKSCRDWRQVHALKATGRGRITLPLDFRA